MQTGQSLMNIPGHEKLLFKILQLNYPMTYISANMLDKKFQTHKLDVLFIVPHYYTFMILNKIGVLCWMDLFG